MTSEPTNQNHIQQTLWSEDFLAKICPVVANALVSQKKRGLASFTNSCESYAWFDPNTSSWKTWQRSLITDWELFSESFPRQGLMQNGELFEQAIMSEPPTTEIDGFALQLTETLPTPTAMDIREDGLKHATKMFAGENSQIIRPTNTGDFERQSNDESNQGQSRVDENLSGSSNTGKAISPKSGGVCELSKKTSNDQGTSDQDKYQENKDRTLVSEGQSGIQLSQHRGLGSDKTTFDRDSIRQRNDNSENKGVDFQKSNITNSDSIGHRGRDSQRCSVQERQIFLQGEQERGKVGSKTQGCNNNTPNTNNNGSFIPKKPTGTEKFDGGSKERKEIFVKSEGSSQSRNSRTVQQTSKWRNTEHLLNPNWKEYGVEPAICGDPDGPTSELLTNRASRLKLLGNGLVPQCAAIPLQRVLDLENESQT